MNAKKSRRIFNVMWVSAGFSLPAGFLTTARAEQGLIQVFQDFCLNDKSACEHCGFPDLLRAATGK